MGGSLGGSIKPWPINALFPRNTLNLSNNFLRTLYWQLVHEIQGYLRLTWVSSSPSPPLKTRCPVLVCRKAPGNYLRTHLGHSILSSRCGGGKLQAGSRKRAHTLPCFSGTQACPAWNCRRTQPSVSAGRLFPWTTHHRTPGEGKRGKYEHSMTKV